MDGKVEDIGLFPEAPHLEFLHLEGGLAGIPGPRRLRCKSPRGRKEPDREKRQNLHRLALPSITVRKLNLAGEQTFAYTGIVLERSPTHVQLEARFGRARMDLGYTVFETGDRFVEWFFADRWYNIFEVHAARNDRIKGWYCNVARPAIIGDGAVSAVDLALDVWIAPDGSVQVLDEDEFAGLELSDADRRAAQAALAELAAMAHRRCKPFDGSGVLDE